MVHKWSIHFFHVFHSPLADDDPHWNLPTTDAATWRPVLGYPCALKGPWSKNSGCREYDQLPPVGTNSKKAEGSVDSCWFKVLHGLARSSQGSDSLWFIIHNSCFLGGKHVTGFRPSWQMRALYINI
jgi:hypothetical protein